MKQGCGKKKDVKNDKGEGWTPEKNNLSGAKLRSCSQANHIIIICPTLAKKNALEMVHVK